MTRIHLSAPDVRDPEREMVLAAIDANWVAPAGPDLGAFEAEVAELCGVPFAVALSSGTAALHLALLELGVGPGDVVLVSTLTFAASANPVHYVGATPVFIDADPATWQISPALVAAELEERARTGRLPAAAIVVDLYGQCADHYALATVLDSYGIPVIEDAAEALGATYRGQPAGSFGTCAVLSFNGNKLITSGGGGILLCHDARLAERARHLSTQAREPVPHYEHLEVGYNYRMSNLLAAFGRGQLATIDERIARRRQINRRYRDALGDLDGVAFMPVADYGTPNCWLTCITLDAKVCGFGPVEARIHLDAADIEARPAWKPMHLQPMHAETPRRVDGTANRIFSTGLCLPSGSGMSDADQDRVIDALLELAEPSR